MRCLWFCVLLLCARMQQSWTQLDTSGCNPMDSMSSLMGGGDMIGSIKNAMGPISALPGGANLGGLDKIFGGGSSSSADSAPTCLSQFTDSKTASLSFGKVIIGCIAGSVQKKIKQCQNDIKNKQISSVTCLFTGGLPGGLSSLPTAAGTGGLPAGFSIPGFGRRKRQFPGLGGLGGGLGNLGGLGGGGIPGLPGGGGAASSAANPPPQDCNVANLARLQCELAAEKANCDRLEQMMNDVNCNMCQLIVMSMKSDDVKKCACDNVPDLSKGFPGPSAIQGTITKCVADQAAGDILKKQMLNSDKMGGMMSQLGSSNLDFFNKC